MLVRQWSSIRRPSGEGTDWGTLDVDGVQLFEQHRHQRKLTRGARRGNAFRIALRGGGIVGQEGALWVKFGLDTGSFATTVLREMVCANAEFSRPGPKEKGGG